MHKMYNPMTEPVRGEAELVTDTYYDANGNRRTAWMWAPSGHRHPFDKTIRIRLLEHVDDENKIVVQWAKQGTYTLRYDDDLAEEIQAWKAGRMYRVKMWADRIEEVLPIRKRKS